MKRLHRRGRMHRRDGTYSLLDEIYDARPGSWWRRWFHRRPR